MKTINMPGFAAEHSLRPVRGRYRSGRSVAVGSDGVIPAIPRCENCDALLDYCAAHGGKPRAACYACAVGNCDSSQENPGGRCWLDPITNRRICDL